ncbi:MAG: sensor histidine kinase [Chitinivibrionales bacterium]
MKNPLHRLDFEWPFIVIAAIVLFAFALPMQRLYIGRLQTTLEQSVDSGLEPLLRNHLTRPNGSVDTAVVSRIHRTRQWQALIPILVKEQSRALLGYSIILFIALLFITTWSARRLTRPLRDLSRAAALIGQGKKPDIAVDAGGALGVLQKNMNSMQEELEALRQKAKTQGMESAWRDIARVMAHEIKNPLTPIQLTLDRIQEKVMLQTPITPSDLDRFVGRISSQVTNLERLVNDFRSFAKEPEAQLRSIPLHASVQSIAEDMKGTIDTHICGQATVRADPFLLNQVFLNIWKNSFEANADTIQATIVSDGGSARIMIRDNGSGILPHHLPKVWIPYETFKKGGTGLGLPVVKRLLDSMHAEIELTSFYGGEDHGTLITITFHVPQSHQTHRSSKELHDTSGLTGVSR